MKKIINLVVFVLLVGVLAPVTALADGFKDVSSKYRFYDEIMYLTDQNVISGFKDGNFKPDNVVTRAQAAIMIGRALDLDGKPRNTKFKDVPSTVTGSGYIDSAVKEGIITGFEDNTYRPDAPVTRGQMAIFLDRAFELTNGKTNTFKDVTSNMKAYQAILNVSSNGIASGYTKDTYRPDTHVNRGQFSAFMARTLEPSFRVLDDKNELAVTINNSNNTILVNGITLGSSIEDVINTLGSPKRIEFDEDMPGQYYVYLLKDENSNQTLELNVYFYNNEVSDIIFEINENIKNTDWYKDLGQPFAVSWGVTYFYLEGTEQILMFKPNENYAYVVYADNNFYDNFGMWDKMW